MSSIYYGEFDSSAALTSMPVIDMMIINGGQKGHITGFTGLSIAVLSHGFQVEIRKKNYIQNCA